MKKTVLLLMFAFAAGAASGQEWRLHHLMGDISNMSPELSYWVPLDEAAEAGPAVFSLWSNMKFSDNVYYEVEYFKGDAHQTYAFLFELAHFAERNKNAEGAVRFISGVQVKVVQVGIGGLYTAVYDRERKVNCSSKAARWRRVLDTFVSFCKQYDIEFEPEQER